LTILALAVFVTVFVNLETVDKFPAVESPDTGRFRKQLLKHAQNQSVAVLFE
jgi:hypothetical protein